MDLYRIDSSLRKGYPEKASPFARTDTAQSGNRNDLAKFSSNDILSSSSWSSVIHQPAQDSEPEDLPSTVDIDAIKQPPTPVNASAQTPARQLQGDSTSFELSDDQNAADSGSESDSDSESGNSENEVENTASGVESGSSESDSVSSRRSSSSSKDKPASSRSSRSNSPPSNSEDQQRFSVRETNLEQGGLKMKLSSVAKYGHGTYDYMSNENSSDSSESKDGDTKDEIKYATKPIRPRKRFPLVREEQRVKNASYKLAAVNKAKRFEVPEAEFDDSDSSSSSLSSPAKRFVSVKNKPYDAGRSSIKAEPSASRFKSTTELDRSYCRSKEEKYEKVNAFPNRKKEMKRNVYKERPPQLTASHGKYRVGQSMFSPPVLKLPGTCKLSEDSDDSDDVPRNASKNEPKKENNRDTLEKLAQQFTRPGNSAEHLQVLNDEDLAAVFPEDSRLGTSNVEREVDMLGGRKKATSVYDHKKISALSDSSSDAEMLPKQNQIVSDAINSIHVDSDESDDSRDSSTRHDSSDESSSSEDEKGKPKEKVQYSSNLLEAFAEKTEQLSKHNIGNKLDVKNSLTMPSSAAKSSVDAKTDSSETCRKRGRPPKSRMSSMAEIESYMKLGCSASNVSPDSGIQSNSGSPLYGVQSPARSLSGNSKKSAAAATAKSLSLSQKAVLGASRKNSQKKKETADLPEVLKNQTNQLPKPAKAETVKKMSAISKEFVANAKTAKSVVESDELDDLIKVPPYLGAKNHAASVNPGAATDTSLLHGKRGPGRPKKPVYNKVNGRTNFDKAFPAKVDNQFHKSFNLAAKPMFTSRAKSKKQKYRSPVVMCLENPKKRRKKKNDSNLAYRSRENAVSANFRGVSNKWLKKRKKHKKKSFKVKVISAEFLKELEGLVELFNKKCVIEDKKAAVKVCAPSTQTEHTRSKPQHRSKERNCKKRKQSDRDSESETNSVVTAPVNDTKVKRRTKKSAVEAPKVPQNNCDQRLPLKKRQYHISTPSVANNSHHHHHHHHHHQLHPKTKIRNEADVPKCGMKSPDVTKTRPPLSPKPKNTSSSASVASAAAVTPATSAPAVADKLPVPEESNKMSKDAETVTKSALTALPQPASSSEPSTSIVVNKLQTSSTSNQPQLITPLPSESTTSSTLSTSSKPPAGVFEPTRKLPTSAKGKKNSIDDVLSKLKEKLKDLESPLKNTSMLIEKIGGSRKETTESVVLPEQRVLRSKRSSSEKDLMLAKKNKLTATVSVRLHKLSNSELINSNNSSATATPVAAVVEAPKEESEISADVESTSAPTTAHTIATTVETVTVTVKEEEKPKLKRRKTRNRTGFPVKKKRKMKKETVTVEERFNGDVQIKEELKVVESNAAETTLEDDCPPIVKDESASPPVQNDDWSDDDVPLARRLAPVLQPIVNVSAPKTEIKEPDEAKIVSEDVKTVKSSSRKTSTATTVVTTEKSKTDSNSYKSLPSRASVRIHCKKQIQEEEEEAAKKEAEKKDAEKKDAAVTKKSVGKEKETIEKRELRPQKASTSSADKKPPVLKKEEPKKVTDKKETKSKASAEVETKVEGDVEKESKPKEETDKEEMSDDSAKQSTAKKDAIPKRRKKFLHAGLFSDFYKEEKQPVVDWKNRFAPFKPKEHPHGLLPPPPYFEDWVRRRQVDFALPYDLWWLDKHEQLPGRAVVESWKYKKIMKNAYNEVKPTNIYETQACNCEFPKEEGKLGCGEDCINRLVYTECSPAVCPLKDRCANQRIQKNSGDKKLVRFMTAEKGIGVKTEKPIKSGEYILEYVGEVVTDKEFKKRMTSLYKNDIHHYCLNLDGGLLIDGHRSGSDGRFVNHSCEPNCEMQKWSVDGYYRMALFALRDIEPGEEITYDYNFALFNPAEGQPCRCGSTNCRGVIGGKSQRISLPNANNTAAGDSSASANGGAAGTSSKKKSRMRPRKQVRKDNAPLGSGESGPNKRRRDSEGSNGMNMLPLRSLQLMIPLKPMSPEEVQVVKEYRIFLQRSLKKVQRIREKFMKENSENPNEDPNKTKMAKSKQSTEFLVQLNALSKQRFIRTRGLAQVDDNPEMTKTLQLAKILRSMYNEVVSAKDERDEKNKPYSCFFLTLPSKRKLPTYYTRVEEPIDLTAIEKNIITGVYKDIDAFDADVNKLITNNVTYYGRISDYGIAAVNLRKAYNIAKLKYAAELQEILGHSLPATFMPEQEDPGDEEEDVIRCICGLFNDEGLMIQCERCLVWQHCDCVRADTNVEDYLCERCTPREVDYDIPLDVAPPDYPKPDEKHYLTLMRDELQIRQGDAVYVLRSIPNPETGEPHTFRTIKTFKFEDCDIFRVEQLWKTNEGQRFSFGHHYLRPHETFHEPTRKFYPNEVLKVPLYETVPLDLIMGRCHVLDPNTYCKGKPIDADPQHVYICEFRVDKEAKLFYKIPRSKQLPVCMKNYAFEKYNSRLKPSRTYAPHGDPKPTIASNNMAANAATSKSTSSQKTKTTKSKENATTNQHKPSKSKECVSNSADANRVTDPVKSEEPEIVVVKDPKVEKQKQRLNSLLLKLLAKKSTKGALDASYLLDMGRRNRKKPAQPRPATPTQN